ncbi:MAG: aldehyde ferredoxin oxidoreductase family protein [Thermodesulfobacteriota bacterium]|nr:aldehyde ferredoxin oxidoreductase family protein [Thermodesulfobacteriota bacterium]
MFGWKGKILRVNLSKGKCFVEDMPLDLARNYIGGRGMGLKILTDEIDPVIDALSEENKLIFATGPLTGTGAPAGGRFIVVSKSPLTGGICNPCCGGYFGANLKYAGYDLVIVEGKSTEPVYLYIRDDVVELRPAGYLWGKWATDTEETLKAKIEDEFDSWEASNTAVVSIGPGGENLIRFACIMADGGRAAGRSGLGAVMGSKKLKAIVCSGTGQVDIADVDAFKKAVADFLQEGRDNGELKKRNMWGTWSLVGRANSSKSQAAFNFQSGYFEPYKKLEDPAYIKEKLFVRDEACMGCPFGCSKRSKLDDPEYPWSAKGPEHESIALLGSNCGIEEIEDVARANYLCNELGLDTITTGATISCAMELFERGYLPEKDIGYALNFGNIKDMLELIKKTAYREDFGEQLAEGGYYVAEKYGYSELFMGIKKQGIPAWHPQCFDVLGLQYATSNVGACHTKATLPFYEGRKDPDRAIEFTKRDQDFLSLADSAVLCWIIYHGPLWNEKLGIWLRTITGFDYTDEELIFMGERIWNLERIFNLKAGLTGKDDSLPKRITDEPRVKNRVVPLANMLPEYYRLRGWDEDGVPTAEKLRELGLENEGAGIK